MADWLRISTTREGFVLVLTVVTAAILSYRGAVLACTFGQEPDPASDNKYRWVIPVEDPCQCTQLGLGSFNTRAPCRPFPVTYYDDFLVSNDPEEIRQWLNCSNGLQICPLGIHPLGMKNNTIPDDKITASSAYMDYKANVSRLDGKGWCATDDNPWIQVEFTTEVYITGVITQGRDDVNVRWVTEFNVSSSKDGQSWDAATDADGAPATFTGNTDATSHVENTFGMPLHTRYIRILPTKCEKYYCMRFELLGCEQE